MTPARSRRHPPARAIGAAVAVLVLAACGSDATDRSASSPATSAPASASSATGGPSPSTATPTSQVPGTTGGGVTTTAAPPASSGPATTGRPPITTSVTAVVLTDADDGTTRTVRVGDTVRLVLASTYWTIDESSNTAVLVALGPQNGTPDLAHCIPGAGCGTMTRSFVALARGTAIVRAHRTVCGEVMQCRKDQQEYSATIVVE